MKTEKTEQGFPEKLKKTKQREMVLDVLSASQQPLSAAELHAQLAKEGQECSLSTVYRNLEALEKANVISKTVLMENGQTLYVLTRHGHKHYAICTNCHKFIPLHDCPMPKEIAELAEENFHITGHNLEIFGLCAECLSISQKRSS